MRKKISELLFDVRKKIFHNHNYDIRRDGVELNGESRNGGNGESRSANWRSGFNAP